MKPTNKNNEVKSEHTSSIKERDENAQRVLIAVRWAINYGLDRELKPYRTAWAGLLESVNRALDMYPIAEGKE